MKTASSLVTFRATSSGVVFAAIVLACVVLLVDAVLRLRWDVVASALPTVSLVVWAGWLIFVRPCLRVGDDGLTVVNILRTSVVPWSQVDEVTTRLQVVVRLASGERLRSWGAPIAARPGRPGRTGRVGGLPPNQEGRAPGSPVQTLVDSRLTGFAGSDGPRGVVRRRWDLMPIALGVALALVVAAQLVTVGLRLP